MSRHEDEMRIRHMLDHAREAVAALKDRPRADLDYDRLLELAVLKLVERKRTNDGVRQAFGFEDGG